MTSATSVEGWISAAKGWERLREFIPEPLFVPNSQGHSTAFEYSIVALLGSIAEETSPGR